MMMMMMCVLSICHSRIKPSKKLEKIHKEFQALDPNKISKINKYSYRLKRLERL